MTVSSLNRPATATTSAATTSAATTIDALSTLPASARTTSTLPASATSSHANTTGIALSAHNTSSVHRMSEILLFVTVAISSLGLLALQAGHAGQASVLSLALLPSVVAVVLWLAEPPRSLPRSLFLMAALLVAGVASEIFAVSSGMSFTGIFVLFAALLLGPQASFALGSLIPLLSSLMSGASLPVWHMFAWGMAGFLLALLLDSRLSARLAAQLSSRLR